MPHFPPHKHTRASDGVTFYYDGQHLYPLLAVRPDGSYYPGWCVDLSDPQVQRLIGEADKRTYYARRSQA